jgi:CubicO group peptidase (beta-lactamase class C family)
MILPLITLTASLALGDGLPTTAPRAVGMSADRLATVDRVVTRGMTAGAYPGAAVVVGRRGYAVWQKGFGKLGWTAKSPAVDPMRSVYDLASLTKVIALTTSVMILHDEGKLPLETRVVDILPAFAGPGKERITIEHLLTHRSGLPAGRQLWKTARTPAEARQQVLETKLQTRPGAVFVYSDLGANVLGQVVEKVSGMRLDKFSESRIFEPLGMYDTGFLPPDSLMARIAPTEVSPPRGYPIRGEVHDEAAFALGGVSGHAGLFGTAADLSVFAQMMLNGGEYNGTRIVSEAVIAKFTRLVKDDRALGWETAAGVHGAGEFLSESAYGHTGYTGTSLWIDPDRDMFVVLLTNRVHAARARRPGVIIADVRNDLADAAALAVTDEPLLQQVAYPTKFRVDKQVDWNPPRRTQVRRASTARSTAKKPVAKKPVATTPN